MAIFFHGNRSIAYQSQLAPFSHDLLLLQASRFSTDFWQPVLDDLKDQTPTGGRVVVCEWFEKGLDVATMAKDLDNLIKTLGLQAVHVVACDDAVGVVKEIEKQNAGRFENTLLYPQSVPRTDDLSRSIRDFSEI